MKIALIEPFFGGSHRQWAETLADRSRHHFEFFTLPGRHWKWRMHGAAITLAERLIHSGFHPDLILATDMLDLPLFLALIRNNFHKVPVAIYFHENQLTYPWSPQDRDIQKGRDHHYAFINYSSALLADRIFFNSNYHLHSFLGRLPAFLNAFPPPANKNSIELIREKSSLLPLGLDLSRFDRFKEEWKNTTEKRGVILWNHRWEYDKNPERFFRVLKILQDRGVEFRLVVLGGKTEKYPSVFDEAREIFKKEILHFGYCDDFDAYAKWLCLSDLLFVTSIQDFFGGSVVEAMYCNVKPFLPMRLAYPEHIPAEYHRSFFYNDEDDIDLANKIQQRLFSLSLLRKQKCDHFVEHYDWKNLTVEYDEAFEDCIRI